MIPRDYITEWRARAPWIEDFQVEQDLVISRALAGIFSDPVLAGALAFRDFISQFFKLVYVWHSPAFDVDRYSTSLHDANPVPIFIAVRNVQDLKNCVVPLSNRELDSEFFVPRYS